MTYKECKDHHFELVHETLSRLNGDETIAIMLKVCDFVDRKSPTNNDGFNKWFAKWDSGEDLSKNSAYAILMLVYNDDILEPIAYAAWSLAKSIEEPTRAEWWVRDVRAAARSLLQTLIERRSRKYTTCSEHRYAANQERVRQIEILSSIKFN